jgi:ATP-dependent DNA helicase PIF1
MSDLFTATLQSLQALLQDCHFLMVNKKSMIDLKMFSLVDDRLQAIFPATSHQLFGGINVLICGDFFQLLPIGGKPLYAHRLSNVNKIKGHQLYQAFVKTIWLTEIM